MRRHHLTSILILYYELRVGISGNLHDNYAVPLHIISVINGNNQIFGYNAIAPVYDVAIYKAKKLYGKAFSNTTYTRVYVPGSFLCAEAAAAMLTTSAMIFQAMTKRPDDFTVIFAPGCSPEITALGDFAREWDTPLFSAIASDRLLTNKDRYPTVITCPAVDHNTISESLQLLLEKYEWRTLTFFCDTLTQYAALQTYYTQSCSNIRRNLEAAKNIQYVIYQLDFDSKTFQDYAYLLRRMQQHSRVSVMFTHPKILRKILMLAKQLNMTTGEYIYLSSQPTRVPTLGTIEWEAHDGDSDEAFEAFQSLIYFNNANANWKTMRGVFEKIQMISTTRYNKTIAEDDIMNDLAMSAYESFSAFAQVWNETSTWEKGQLTGTTLARVVWNRTFVLPSRDMYISANGLRRTDAVYYKLNKTSKVFEVAWHYNAISSKLVEMDPVLAETWYGGGGAPLDIPRCGFLRDLCQRSGDGSAVLTGSVVAVLCVVMATAAALVIWLKRRSAHDDKNLWWHLEESLLHYRQAKFPVNDADHSPEHGPLGKITKAILRHEQKLLLFGQYDQTVWTEIIAEHCVPPEDIVRHKHLRDILHLLKDLNHSNVGRFFGILSSPASNVTCLIFEFGSRGTLYSLLQSERLLLDRVIQAALIWEIIDGLKFIHVSSLRCHGMLSSLSVTVNQRFRPLLINHVVTRFRKALHNNVFPECIPPDPAVLWTAPEMITENLNGKNTSIGSKEADIFSLSIIMVEILLPKSVPFLTKIGDLSVQSLAAEGWSFLRELCIQRTIDLPQEELPGELRNVIHASQAEDPRLRPDMGKFTAVLSRHIPRRKLVETILSRLEDYAEELETTVFHRTCELTAEQRKVDQILGEIIPSPLIHNLRNKIPINPELFESVTISFNDVPHFDSIYSQSTPLECVRLLNDLHNAFDAILSRFNVYKVETVNDCYMLASGIPVRSGILHAGEICKMALAMRQTTITGELCGLSSSRSSLQIRTGINSGSCVAGVVGLRMPRYCLFGDTINTASRMETTGEESKIQISGATKALLENIGGYVLDPRGMVEVKGKGTMETFWLIGLSSDNDARLSEPFA